MDERKPKIGGRTFTLQVCEGTGEYLVEAQRILMDGPIEDVEFLHDAAVGHEVVCRALHQGMYGEGPDAVYRAVVQVTRMAEAMNVPYPREVDDEGRIVELDEGDWHDRLLWCRAVLLRVRGNGARPS